LTNTRAQLTTIRPVADEWEWQYSGLCRSADPELFFLEVNMRLATKRKREEEAKKICKSCPVIYQCRSHALNVPETYGVWGGLSADEREQILTTKGD
jgi:WhiB family redox-sensing transcriptional regulator